MAIGAVAAGGAILGGVGAWAAGSAIAISTGIALGWSIGMYAGQQFFGPDVPSQDVEGPRLSSLSVQSSAYGEPITIVYGSVRTAGNIIWSAGIEEHKHEEDVGGGGGKGGGGGGGGTRTTYTYTCSFAVGVCEGVIVGINRIWMDGKLFQDNNSDSDFVSQFNSVGKVSSLSVYTGTEDQEPDPVIESHEGEGNVPGYRGLAYVVFEDLELADYGNRIPNIEFEVALGLQEQNATFEVPDETSLVSFFNNGYLAAAKPNNLNPSDSWTQVLNLEGNILFEWQGNDSNFLIPFQVSPQVSSSLGKEMALYLESFDDHFYVIDAATGEELVEIENYWDGSDDVFGISNPNRASIGWLEEFGYYIWIIWGASNSTLGIYNYSAATGGINTEVDTVSCSDIGHVLIFDNKIYIGHGTAVYEYISWYDIGIVTDATTGEVSFGPNELGNYNKKVDFSETSGGSFVAITPNGDLISKNGTTCYLHDGINAEIQKRYTFDTGDSGKQPIDAIISDIMDITGLESTEYDVSDLSDNELIGFAITQPMSAKKAINPLMQAFQFDVIESEGEIKFVSRGNSLERSFSEDDLAAHEQGSDLPPSVTTTRTQKTQLPTKVVIDYQDKDIDYQVASQYAKREVADHNKEKSIRLPIVMTANDALQVAEKFLATAWAQRDSHSVQILSENIDLLPGSVIDVAGYRMLVSEMSNKMPGLIEVKGPSEESSSYQSSAVAETPSITTQVPAGATPSTFSLMINLPNLERVYSTPGFFVVPYSLGSIENWPGANIYTTYDNGNTWSEIDIVLNQTLVASIISAPGSGPVGRWDHANSITIRPINERTDLLLSASELSVFSGSNTVAIGSSSDKWEVLSFLDVTDNGDGTYTLSGFIRGRRGTEDAVDSGNKSLLVFLKSDAMGYVPLSTDNLDVQMSYKITSIGNPLQTKATSVWTSEGDTIKPWSPVHIEGTRNFSDDLIITWLRRSRGEESWNRVGVPLIEQNEEYEIDILDSNGDVVRTFSTSGEDSDQSGITYTATQQDSDFGSVQSSVTVEVYQISDVVGRGFPGKAIV